VLLQHLKRMFTFSVIGVFVLVAGILVQWATFRPLGSNGSYFAQAAFSIALGYVLNRRITWRDRDVTDSLLKWNAQRIGFTIPHWAGYALLIHFGVPWLGANLAVTAVLSVINYVSGDVWSFRQAATIIEPGTPLPAGWMPTVSVVIPCKSNERTIGATAESLLSQDYPNLIELIIVGDVGDSTWKSLSHISDPRLTLLEHHLQPGLREPNVKRDEGLIKARGEVLALADSDIVMDPDWVSRAVDLLRQQGSGLVAGGMRSIHNSFWGRFVDGNVLAAKTPRISMPYQVTAKNFGKHGYRPPISANAVFMRELYRQTPLDVTWFYGYEDYEWYWRVARDGHRILVDGSLTAAHHHRRSFRRLLQEYRRSAEGCARFSIQHRDCPLARKRILQAILLPLVAALGAAALGWDVASGYVAPVLLMAVAGGVVLGAREAARTGRLDSLAYPVVGLMLAGTFTLSLAMNLVRGGTVEGDVSSRLWDAPATPAQGDEATVLQRHNRPRPRWIS
jgi:putative flippase GtrA/GT2 family glycosyltransferase